MKIKDIAKIIEESAPHAYAENWDNVGLLVGDPNKEIKKIITALDFTEEVLDEAIEKNAEMIITHHPAIFGAIKKITTNDFTTRLIIKAIKHDIAIYAAHTNLDNVKGGLNYLVAEKFKLQNCFILEPTKANVYKLTYYVPLDYAEKVLKAIFDAGAGSIGNYDSCSFASEGIGTFKAKEGANPFIGDINKLHFEEEKKYDVIVLAHYLDNVIKALLQSHPYELPAYNIIAIDNDNYSAGSGVIGKLAQPINEKDFLKLTKDLLVTSVLRHSKLTGRMISKVAICTGSGAFLLPQAIRKDADVFITGDVKYHDFYSPDGKLLLIDAGHYETEQLSKEWFVEIIKSKFNDFDIEVSEKGGNPIGYWV
ncbi:MAG: Nif3-like dinuclear metal center hexameric protein [Bacteroidales bacterium]|jgi:dinuclear metal center YbgI/SA1388 family protein|nr:Nif3-like dinuclear metal center hexameric protein [Bacteroidales bacterium]